MSRTFEELDFRRTALGELSLRRRWVAAVEREVYEIKLNDEFLMSSLFTASEAALGRLGIAAALDASAPADQTEPPAGDTAANTAEPAAADADAEAAATEEAAEPAQSRLDVVVGGLGLGYTAQAVLAEKAVRSLLVVEALDAVIEWHAAGLLPVGDAVAADPRCRLLSGDFFGAAASEEGFDPEEPGRCFHAVLVDIDHSPDLLLDSRNESFYARNGLRRLAGKLTPRGVFGLWSNDPPDEAFARRLEELFSEVRAEPVTFHNPLTGRDFTQSVYVARTE